MVLVDRQHIRSSATYTTPPMGAVPNSFCAGRSPEPALPNLAAAVAARWLATCCNAGLSAVSVAAAKLLKAWHSAGLGLSMPCRASTNAVRTAHLARPTRQTRRCRGRRCLVCSVYSLHCLVCSVYNGPEGNGSHLGFKQAPCYKPAFVSDWDYRITRKPARRGQIASASAPCYSSLEWCITPLSCWYAQGTLLSGGGRVWLCGLGLGGLRYPLPHETARTAGHLDSRRTNACVDTV